MESIRTPEFPPFDVRTFDVRLHSLDLLISRLFDDELRRLARQWQRVLTHAVVDGEPDEANIARVLRGSVELRERFSHRVNTLLKDLF